MVMASVMAPGLVTVERRARTTAVVMMVVQSVVKEMATHVVWRREPVAAKCEEPARRWVSHQWRAVTSSWLVETRHVELCSAEARHAGPLEPATARRRMAGAPEETKRKCGP